MAEDTENKLTEIDYEKLKTRKQTREKTPDYREFYVNSLNLEVTFHDFTLIFGEIAVATQDELKINEKVGIVMSPEHALACAKALDRVLKNYVQRFGPVREQPGAGDIEPEVK